MRHRYRKSRAYISRIFLVFNKKANSNFKPHRFIKLKEEISKNRIPLEGEFVVPDDKIPYSMFHEGDTFLMFGGDGTIHRFLSELYKNGFQGKINICHLRGGTMNTVAECLRIPKTDELLRKLGERLRSGDPQEVISRTPIAVKTEELFLCGFMFGALVPYKFLEKYYSGKFLGPIKGAITVMESVYDVLVGRSDLAKKEMCELAFRKKENHEGEIRESAKKEKEEGKKEVRWQRLEEEFLIIGAGAIHSFGLNFSNFPKAPDAEGSFNLIAFHGSPHKIVIYLPLIYFGELPKEAINELVDEAYLEFRRKVGFTVDGDLYQARRIELTTAPEVNFIT